MVEPPDESVQILDLARKRGAQRHRSGDARIDVPELLLRHRHDGRAGHALELARRAQTDVGPESLVRRRTLAGLRHFTCSLRACWAASSSSGRC